MFKVKTSTLKKWGNPFYIKQDKTNKINFKAFKKVYKKGKRRAGQLSYLETKHETVCKEVLMSLKIRFEFQKPFAFMGNRYPRIVDFFFPDQYVAIEIDGPDHFTPKGIFKDRKRQWLFLEHYPHIKFLRYRNEEVMETNFRSRLIHDLLEIEPDFAGQGVIGGDSSPDFGVEISTKSS